MKHIIIILFSSLISINSFAQVSEYSEPEFIGGQVAFHEYLSKNLKYPHDLLEQYILGKVKATIFINSKGKIENVEVEGINNTFNQAVKKVLLSMPLWKPAYMKGEAVDTTFVKLFYFSIDFSHTNNDTTIYECMTYRNTFSKDEKIIQQVKADALYKNGVYEVENKNYSLAIDFFNKAEELGLKKNDLYFNRGVAYFKMGDKQNACKDWQAAANLGDKQANDIIIKKCN